MRLKDLILLILALRRSDLCERLGFDRPDRQESFQWWLIVSGRSEYKALEENQHWLQTLSGQALVLSGFTRLQELVYLARTDIQKNFRLPKASRDYLFWFWSHAVLEHKLLPLLTPRELLVFQKIGVQTKEPRQKLSVANINTFKFQSLGKSTPNRRFGVNLIGYPYSQTGIGEDLRQTLIALRMAGVPFSVVDFLGGSDTQQGDRSVAQYVVKEGRYAINLFCMTALETGRFYAEHGEKQFQGRYNIGYWPWELSNWPNDWKLVFDLVDEVWVGSSHIYNSLSAAQSPAFTKPIRIMPLVVEIGLNVDRYRSSEVRVTLRKKFRLPRTAKLFFFSFDINSSIHRKNPQAVVRAFLKAFPEDAYSSRKVGLVVKVHPPQKANRSWEALKALAANDRRIYIIQQTLPRDELLAFYAACDSFVSLHRTEGFGRSLSEALQLGLHLICTGYGGNIDFCRRPEFAKQVSLVPYRLVRVQRNQYPYAEGQVWAKPSISSAAQAMKEFVDNPVKPAVAPRDGWPCFSAKHLGPVYAQRLREVFEKNGELTLN